MPKRRKPVPVADVPVADVPVTDVPVTDENFDRAFDEIAAMLDAEGSAEPQKPAKETDADFGRGLDEARAATDDADGC